MRTYARADSDPYSASSVRASSSAAPAMLSSDMRSSGRTRRRAGSMACPASWSGRRMCSRTESGVRVGEEEEDAGVGR